MYLMEFLIFTFLVTIGVCILYFCCSSTSTRADDFQTMTSQVESQRHNRLAEQSNKTFEGPPPIFTISTMSSTSRAAYQNEIGFVDIYIDDQPPPHYDDVIVRKPTNPI